MDRKRVLLSAKAQGIMSGRGLGSSLVLSSLLALLSYVPFEYVAKGTLLISVALFVLDPIPPLTRLLSLLLTAVLLVVTRLLSNWQDHHHSWCNDEPLQEHSITTTREQEQRQEEHAEKKEQ